MVFYCLAELAGGLAGGLMAHAFLGGSTAAIPRVGLGYNVTQAFFAEFFGTVMLCLSVLNAGCSSDTEGSTLSFALLFCFTFFFGF